MAKNINFLFIKKMNNYFFRNKDVCTSGGNSEEISDFFVSIGGRGPSEEDYPYEAKSTGASRCNNFTSVDTESRVVKAYYDHECNEEKLKRFLIEFGSVVVTKDATALKVGNQEEEVFQGCPKNSTETNHSVVVVGYGTSEDGIPFWKVKNSWGTTWKNEGFFNIERGVNACLIENFCLVVTCKKD